MLVNITIFAPYSTFVLLSDSSVPNTVYVLYCFFRSTLTREKLESGASRLLSSLFSIFFFFFVICRGILVDNGFETNSRFIRFGLVFVIIVLVRFTRQPVF